MHKINPLLLADAYKISHPFQYPSNTIGVYTSLIARKSRDKKITSVVWFGLQAFIKEYLMDQFQKNFFDKPKIDVINDYKRRCKAYFGQDLPSYKHVEDLHNLGYLPVKIKALPEGSSVGIGVPMMTIVNTDPRFAWVTNFLETIMSTSIWRCINSATTARSYRAVAETWALVTCDNTDHIKFQVHDFSMRGMGGLEDAILSGMAHLLFFCGSDTIPAVDGLQQYYYADIYNDLIAASVPATEHSVMCAGSKEGEMETFQRLLNTYPKGILSVVSDTWDLWKVLTEYLPALKDQIMSRDGKLVIRPDSGNPVDIICGVKAIEEEWDNTGLKYRRKDVYEKEGDGDVPSLWRAVSGAKPVSKEEEKGVVELLWEAFGGTINEKGYKVLDPHIGAIYGDGITPEVFDSMCERLHEKGFASSNIVVGAGSFGYVYNTRDTYGMAFKASACWTQDMDADAILHEIFKDPVTDDGTKKSKVGLLRVDLDEKGRYVGKDHCTEEEEAGGELKVVFENGKLVRIETISIIRKRVNDNMLANFQMVLQ